MLALAVVARLAGYRGVTAFAEFAALLVRVHNESEAWQALAPDSHAADLSQTGRVARNHILAGAGALPEHWLGGGGDVNRATAAEMGSPAHKMLAMRRAMWTGILRRAAQYAVARRLDPSGNSWPDFSEPQFSIQVDWPEMVTADLSKHAAALAQATGAVAVALDRGLLSRETAVHVVTASAERLGLEIDAKEELARAEADEARQAEEDAFPQPPADEED